MTGVEAGVAVVKRAGGAGAGAEAGGAGDDLEQIENVFGIRNTWEFQLTLDSKLRNSFASIGVGSIVRNVAGCWKFQSGIHH